MSFIDHINRLLRKSNDSASSTEADPNPKPKRSLVRILSRRSKQSKSSGNSTNSNTTSTRSGSQNTARTSITAVENGDDMASSAERLRAAFDAYELRMGATWRVSIEAISPCNTRGMAV